MDESDRATEVEMAQRQIAVHNATHQSRRLLPTGECLSCGEEVESPRLFCNSDCSGEFERLTKRLGRK